MLFGEIRQPTTNYIIIPKVSGYRKYIPIGILPPDVITNGSALIIPNASLCYFGVLASLMHNIWVRHNCSYLCTSIQYSASIVYNNFPWPENPTDKQKQAVEKLAQKILDAREEYTSIIDHAQERGAS